MLDRKPLGRLVCVIARPDSVDAGVVGCSMKGSVVEKATDSGIGTSMILRCSARLNPVISNDG